MLKTLNLSYTYENQDKLSFPDIHLPSNQHLLVLGASGVGKTTLMYLMSGLLPPQKGNVFIENTDLGKLSRKKLDKFRGKNIGLIFQQYHFIKSLNVEDNLRLRQSFPNNLNDIERRRNLAERLGLSNHLKKNVTKLSQGQQQRLSIALGLINQPKIVFADEPTSNLDDVNCIKVIELLKEEAEISQSSLIIITHDIRVKYHFKNQISL